jgi:predicted transcriptional regulator
MSQTLLEMTKDLVHAQIQAHKLSPEDMRETLRTIHTCLLGLHTKEASYGQDVIATPERHPGRNWRTSISKHFVRCLICGAIFKQLTVKHLRVHGLDTRSYRGRFQIPRLQPLAARVLTAERKQRAQQFKPWEKAPRFIQKQERTRQSAVKKSGQRAGKRA